MAEQESHKRPRVESSDHATKLHDDVAPGEKHDYTKVLPPVEVHGKEPLHVVCSSNPEEANKMIRTLRLKVGGLREKIVGIDVEFTREDQLNQRAAVLQLCVEDQVLVYHITVETEMPDWLDLFLKEKMYSFTGFSIDCDKRMLKNSGLEINPNNYIGIQAKWRDLYTAKEYDSLADIAGTVVHPFYKDMKKKIDRKDDHKLWGINPLPEYLIEYAAIDAHATYASWKKLIAIKKGFIKQQYEKQYGNPYSYYG